jgi:hypothetical protein
MRNFQSLRERRESIRRSPERQVSPMDEKLLEVRLNEATSLKRLVADDTVKDELPAGRRLSLKLIDAILAMEDGETECYPLWLTEPEFWLINSLVFEESKDMFGASMKPLLRTVWRQLREFHESELLQSPDLELAAEAEEEQAQRRLALWKSSTTKDDGLSEIGG